MADDKIRVTWEEVQSPDVDVRIQQQQVLNRAQDHYQQYLAPPTANESAMTRPRRSIWYNSVFYMALFGLVGGLIGWATGELVELVIPDRRQEFSELLVIRNQIEERFTRGAITETEAKNAIARLERQYERNPYLMIFNDASLTENEQRRRVEEQMNRDWWKSFIQQLVWFSSVGVPLAFFLAIADQCVGRNWRGVVVNGSIGIVLGVLGGLVVGAFINHLYQAMGGGHGENLGKQILARAIGWAILGLFLSIAPGVVLKNWKRFGIGLAGGLLGGLLGGVLFDPICTITNNAVVSRMIAIVAIGVIAGLGTGLIEKAAKTGWLRVLDGLIAGKQFVVYKNPTYVGSSPQCEIYLFKDPNVGPRHAAVRTVPGGYALEDLQSASGTFVNDRAVTNVRLRNNDRIRIGRTVFQFQEKARTLA